MGVKEFHFDIGVGIVLDEFDFGGACEYGVVQEKQSRSGVVMVTARRINLTGWLKVREVTWGR
jgi:hypothetical protein